MKDMNNSTSATPAPDIDGSQGYVIFVGIVLLLFSVLLAVKKVPRNGGRNIWYQLAYFALVGAIVASVPHEYALDMFNPVSIILICTIFPLYESIRAICTVESDDDTSWLQYWIAQGILSFASEWVNESTKNHPKTRQYWYQFKFFYFLWLLLPFTDGAALLYDFVTEPLIVPLIAPSTKKLGAWIAFVVTTIINAAHLWFFWFVFFFLDPHIKNFVTVLIGTFYPILASIVAVSTPQGDDDTYWLTYWVCYGFLYLIMGFFKRYLEHIPGFYSIFIFLTLYLMLPMFRGSESIFRNIIAPLAGKTEMLLLRDSVMLRRDMESKMPPGRHEYMRNEMSKVFSQLELEVPTTRRKPNYSNSDGYQEIRPNVV